MPLNLKGVKLRPHLSFSKTAAVQPTILSDLYILAGKKTNTTCYIGAHGEALDNRSFTVPAGVTVRFTQPHGYTMSMPMNTLRHTQPVVDTSGWGQVTYGPNTNCPNYFLTKWHGRHSGVGTTATHTGTKEEWEQAEEDYWGWQRIVAYDTNLTFAFPRNRWNKTGISLEHVITSVLKPKVFPAVTTFWCLFCRYDEAVTAINQGYAWNYNAQIGQWS